VMLDAVMWWVLVL
jgi:hypothetical protein